MVNNSENSQTQRVNDPRRNEARSGDHERGNARQIRGFRVGSSPMPLADSESLPSREAAQMAEQLFSRSSSPHGRTATIFLRRRGRVHHHLSSGRRWCRCSLRPGSSTSSSLSHHRSTASSIPLSASSCPRVTVLPSLRSCQRNKPVSALDPLPKFSWRTVFSFSKMNYYSSSWGIVWTIFDTIYLSYI